MGAEGCSISLISPVSNDFRFFPYTAANVVIAKSDINDRSSILQPVLQYYLEQLRII
jgi:hypothetical protein